MAFYSYDYYTTNNTYYNRAYKLYSKNADGTMTTYDRHADAYLKRQTDPSYGTVMQLSLNYDKSLVIIISMFWPCLKNSIISGRIFIAQRSMLLDGEYLLYGENEGQIGKMDGAGDKTRRAFVGRMNYDYKGRYMVDFSLRYDGSSSFPRDSRWGLFPAVSVGWRASEETL